MKQSTPRRLFTFARIATVVVAGLVLLDTLFGQSFRRWISEKDMAAPLAIYVTLTLACVWAVAGRSHETLKEFGWYGRGLDSGHPEMKIGWFVRILCALVTAISLLPAMIIVALSLTRWDFSFFSPSAIAMLFGTICIGIFFGYLAIFGRIPEWIWRRRDHSSRKIG